MPPARRKGLLERFVVLCKLCAVVWLVGAMPAVWFFSSHGGLPHVPGVLADGPVAEPGVQEDEPAPAPGFHFSSEGRLKAVSRTTFLAGVFILAVQLIITLPALLGIWYALRGQRCPICGGSIMRGRPCPNCLAGETGEIRAEGPRPDEAD